MSEIVIVGGGIAGLTGAMLLARDGHHVIVLERDPASPPCDPAAAWAEWERRGVNHFRLAHAFLPRFRALLDAELPDVAATMAAWGALRMNRVADLPLAITGGWRPADERFEQITGRRPMMEAALALSADQEPGVEIRRGVAVRGLTVADGASGIPHATGVVTDAGEVLSADLVVDAGGRRSSLPDWLAAAGARRPIEESADSGFVYFSRHYRSADGIMPPLLGPPLQHYESLSTLTAPADNGHWSVTLVASAKDAVLRQARHVDVWERIVRSYPLITHWIDAIPTTGVDVIAKIADRVRRFVVDGKPVATGVVAVGDASACTNPSVGRGASIALLHVTCLRDVLRRHGLDDPLRLIRRWNETTAAVVTPLVDDTLRFDRHRLAQIEAQIDGVPYETDDPAWRFGQALGAAAARDPDLLRAAIDVVALIERGVDVIGREGILEKLLAIGPVDPLPGPNRAELVGLLSDRVQHSRG